MIALSELRPWVDADDISSVYTAGTNTPAANLRTSNMLLHWQDANASSLGGVTWDTNNVSTSCWAVVLAGMNQNHVEATVVTFDIELSTSATWDGLNLTQRAVTYKMHPSQIWGTVARPDIARHDGLVVFGVDALTTGQAVTGVPVEVAHKSGRVQWRGVNLTDGHHRGGYLGIARAPLLFPGVSAMSVKTVPLLRGTGYEVVLGWEHLPTTTQTISGSTVYGRRELDNFVAANRDKPIMAILDLSGLTSSGVATTNNSEATPAGRLGLAKIVSRNPADFVGPVGTHLQSWNDNLTLRTWGETEEE